MPTPTAAGFAKDAVDRVKFVESILGRLAGADKPAGNLARESLQGVLGALGRNHVDYQPGVNALKGELKTILGGTNVATGLPIEHASQLHAALDNWAKMRGLNVQEGMQRYARRQSPGAAVVGGGGSGSFPGSMFRHVNKSPLPGGPAAGAAPARAID